MTVDALPSLRTEYPFTLPRGFVDEHGRVHAAGRMRLATAKDELTAQAEPHVRQDPAYLSVYLLMRTITALGSVPAVGRFVIQHLVSADLAFLQDPYPRINHVGHTPAG